MFDGGVKVEAFDIYSHNISIVYRDDTLKGQFYDE